jgi:hypothetical protein
MKHGSLFSGIGGFDLAAQWMGWENVFHCEINEFGRKVLHHYWPDAIQYSDIKTTDFKKHHGTIDIISGGFPCQPYTVPQENEKAKRMNATCGRKCLEQFERFPRAGLWAKTFAALLIGTGEWYSTKCRLTWKLKATKCCRFYFQLAPLVLPTEGIGFGLLHTPRAVMIEETNERFQQRMGDRNSTTYPHLLNQIKDYVLKGLMPTPQVIDHKIVMKKDNRFPSVVTYLNNELPGQLGNGSHLNPQFVMEMMGFPPTHTLEPFKMKIQWIEV